MRTFLRFLIAFLALTGAAVIATGVFGVRLGNDDFWVNHGMFFLLFITLFPRLTILLSSVATGGLVWWLGWLFMPRLLVAVLATAAYWNHNPILVVFAWLVALGGESSEKFVVVRRGVRGGARAGFESAKWVKHEE